MACWLDSFPSWPMSLYPVRHRHDRRQDPAKYYRSYAYHLRTSNTTHVRSARSHVLVVVRANTCAWYAPVCESILCALVTSVLPLFAAQQSTHVRPHRQSGRQPFTDDSPSRGSSTNMLARDALCSPSGVICLLSRCPRHHVIHHRRRRHHQLHAPARQRHGRPSQAER